MSGNLVSYCTTAMRTENLFVFSQESLKGSGHYWLLLQITISTKPFLVTSNGEIVDSIKHCEKRLPLK